MEVKNKYTVLEAQIPHKISRQTGLFHIQQKTAQNKIQKGKLNPKINLNPLIFESA